MIFKAMVSPTSTATCKICQKFIKKGQHRITAYGFRDTGSVHADAKDCKRQKESRSAK